MISSSTSGEAIDNVFIFFSISIEEIITINELQTWTDELKNNDIDGIIRDIDIYYKLEMNMDAEGDAE